MTSKSSVAYRLHCRWSTQCIFPNSGQSAMSAAARATSSSSSSVSSSMQLRSLHSFSRGNTSTFESSATSPQSLRILRPYIEIARGTRSFRIPSLSTFQHNTKSYPIRRSFSTAEATTGTLPEDVASFSGGRSSSKKPTDPGPIVLSDEKFEAIPMTSALSSVLAPQLAQKRKTPAHLKYKSINTEVTDVYPDSVFSLNNPKNIVEETGELLPLNDRLRINRECRAIAKANAPLSVRDPGNPMANPDWEKTWMRRNAELVLYVITGVVMTSMLWSLYIACTSNPNEPDQKFHWKVGEVLSISCWLGGLGVFVFLLNN